MAWELWNRSRSLRCKPSDLVRIKSTVKAFYFDRAIWSFCETIESALQEVDNQNINKKSGKRKKSDAALRLQKQQVLDRMLKIDPKKSVQKFKDPALNFKGPNSGKSGGRVKMSDDHNEIELGSEFLG